MRHPVAIASFAVLTLVARGSIAAEEQQPAPAPSPAAGTETPDAPKPPEAKAKEEKPKEEKPKAPAGPAGEVKVGVSGFAHTDYRLGDAGAQKGAAEHEFNVRRLRLAFRGKVRDKISYNVVVQGDSANVNTASVLDASVDLSLRPLANFRVGQFKYAFDIQGLEGSAVLPFIDRPFATNAVAGSMNGASTAASPASSFRDRGLSFFGAAKPKESGFTWGYAIGIYQGSGRASDNNSKFGYMLNLNLTPVKDLMINGAFMAADNVTTDAAGDNTYQAWTFGATYEHNRVLLRSEYYQGKRDLGATSQDVSGFYVLGGFSASPKVDLLARYQKMEDDQFTKNGKTANSVDLGVKWYLSKSGKRGGTHLALNYMARNADAGFNKGMSLLNDNRGAALTSGDFVKGVFQARLQVQF